MLKMALWILAGLAIVLVILSAFGEIRWHDKSRELLAKLEATRTVSASKQFNAGELETLPPPVQRYLRLALTEGQPLVAAVNLAHAGTFNPSEATEMWKPFESTQRVIPHGPGFVWNASMSMLPGIHVRVHDAYVAGEGDLRPSILGLWDLTHLRGNGDIAQGELLRFLAEAVWYPTALLPSQGVRWNEVDAYSARATLDDAGVSVSLTFRFGDDGLVSSIRAAARGRIVGGKVVPTQWEGRWWNYRSVDGMRIPMNGEVAWMLPEGPKPYWRGQVARVDYEFTH